MNSSHPTKKLAYIDALRGLAVLMVIVVHVSALSSVPVSKFLQVLLSEGARGVQLFFIISAFTLFLSLNQRLDDKHLKFNFFIRRFFRLAPLWYLMIILYLTPLGAGIRAYWDIVQPVNFANILFNLAFLIGLHPYYIVGLIPGGWSVGTEVLFYLLVPWLFTKISSLKQAVNYYFLAICLSWLAVNYLLSLQGFWQAELWSNFIVFSIFKQLPIFFIGIILFFVLEKKDRQLAVWQKLVLVVLPLLFLIIDGFKLIAISWLFGLLFYYLSNHKFILLNNRVLRLVGKLSYSIYLLHFAVIYFIHQLAIDNFFFVHFPDYYLVPLYLTVVALSVGVSYGSYRLIEKPFVALGNSLCRSAAQSLESR